jgi:hypothetical protein
MEPPNEALTTKTVLKKLEACQRRRLTIKIANIHLRDPSAQETRISPLQDSSLTSPWIGSKPSFVPISFPNPANVFPALVTRLNGSSNIEECVYVHESTTAYANHSQIYETKHSNHFFFFLCALAKEHGLVTEYTPCQSTWMATEEPCPYR